MAPTYSPAVLIVDDDTGITSYLREKFHEMTSVGVLVANDLNQAKDLIDNREIRFDAILADLNFEKAKKAPESHLYDGIDILRYSKEQRNGIKRYVLSFWNDRQEEHERAEEQEVEVRDWLPKMYYADPKSPETPWAILERDLLKARIAPASAPPREDDDPPADPIDLTDAIRGMFPTPIRTFIQSLGDDSVYCKRPIEVICLRDESGVYRSHAVRIGLFQEGQGDTVDDSVADLAANILDQFKRFSAEQDEAIRDYARVVRNEMLVYVEKA